MRAAERHGGVMRRLFALTLVVAGCPATNTTQDMQMQMPGDMAVGDMAVTIDMSHVDIASTDFASTDMAQPVDMAQAPLQASVDVNDNFYSPANVTIKATGTVTWTWVGSAPHTVTNNGGTEVFASSQQTSGTFMHTFPNVGVFNYSCAVHGVGMSGIVTVVP